MATTVATNPSRPRGTGSVQWKPNGHGRTYYAVVRVDGKPKWLRAGPTSRDAEVLLHQVYAGVVDPLSFGRRPVVEPAHEEPDGRIEQDPEPWPFDEYADAWLEQLERRPRKPGTKDGYRCIVRNVLVPCLGAKPLDKVEARDAWCLVTQRMNGTAPVQGRCHKAVSLERALREMAVLRKMLGDAVKWDLIGENPCLGLEEDLRDEYTHDGRPRSY